MYELFACSFTFDERRRMTEGVATPVSSSSSSTGSSLICTISTAACVDAARRGGVMRVAGVSCFIATLREREKKGKETPLIS